MEKHFVVFYSPGTFFSEATVKPIDSWDVKQAVEMSHSVLERYNAKPYGFRFQTRTRTDEDLDSKVTKTSCMYHLGGTVYTLAEVEERNDPSEDILRSNMRGNDIKAIIVNTNSWKSTLPLGDDDVILEYTQ